MAYSAWNDYRQNTADLGDGNLRKYSVNYKKERGSALRRSVEMRYTIDLIAAGMAPDIQMDLAERWLGEINKKHTIR
jgi:hypothetical protein